MNQIQQKKLLKELKDLVEEDSVFIYLVEPLEQLLNELDNTIAFSQYTIKDGKIFVYEVQDAVRIRTGERGSNAL